MQQFRRQPVQRRREPGTTDRYVQSHLPVHSQPTRRAHLKTRGRPVGLPSTGRRLVAGRVQRQRRDLPSHLRRNHQRLLAFNVNCKYRPTAYGSLKRFFIYCIITMGRKRSRSKGFGVNLLKTVLPIEYNNIVFHCAIYTTCNGIANGLVIH